MSTQELLPRAQGHGEAASGASHIIDQEVWSPHYLYLTDRVPKVGTQKRQSPMMGVEGLSSPSMEEMCAVH